jgi:hypothetical protein
MNDPSLAKALAVADDEDEEGEEAEVGSRRHQHKQPGEVRPPDPHHSRISCIEPVPTQSISLARAHTDKELACIGHWFDLDR